MSETRFFSLKTSGGYSVIGLPENLSYDSAKIIIDFIRSKIDDFGLSESVHDESVRFVRNMKWLNEQKERLQNGT